MNSHFVISSLGYPRIGENREWKKLLESFWAGKTEEEGFEAEMKKLRLQRLQKQRELGVELIPVGDFTLYDHVLDTSAMFGLVPSRYGYAGGPVSLATYFAMARGSKEAPACEMTKWFNTNYHYIVPELGEAEPRLVGNRPLAAYLEAKNELGIDGKPVLVGPFTFVKLAKGYKQERFAELVEQLVPLYAQVLRELEQAGARWVQIDEPSLVTDLTAAELAVLKSAYKQLSSAAPGLNVILQTYFEAVSAYQTVIELPVKAIGLDFVHGREGNLRALREFGFPAGKTLAAGIIDGRNIWRSDLGGKRQLLEELAAIVPGERLIVQPSCSLLHVPVSLAREEKLDATLLGALAFAGEKLGELAVLAQAARGDGGEAAAEAIAASTRAVAALNASPARSGAAADVAAAKSSRALPFAERQQLQETRWQLPLLPTTTIGSFPQTAEVRKARQLWRKGEWTEAQYDAFVQEQIRVWIGLQEDIGLDVLVHGEFERTDMVEFFGEKLDGFAFTQNGWVQSYGSRCVKPPVIYGDVRFSGPMTVKETVFAQSLTAKPVKGMLTGPVTILNWSFVRDDISRKDVTYQIALALREEVDSLEAAGIGMIQVDEPALREGLPLKNADRQTYLDWGVESFRLATSTVRDTTQIHTHMCYCEFHDMIDAISALDADVISIETSRSHGELISAFETETYDKGIGLGVYDIHSPRVPDKNEMLSMIGRALRVLPGRLFWINPDCGLKTRGQAETVAALRNMVAAASEARLELQK
ncbi:5-methyltetrahydropteroyltriglutamate--homocysteine S-methyltransferase [Paenibacillus contaminans]|uniref:5-methyltetrahydropteroyltriglutamate--homocysteine methyltransferase n=1 Tax=Paenibacillus contaminans TaxID=450362 RepID=A0A329MXT2_9BACL|nr:5-methyltetrahydropteroyltriglutamate--homocysteine S-methyltransferase [Paenibacillus contaminans]RAV22527.1 5-methyltetrahydropteroyltriglutamate--homocysteine S-methyltransferase [Paenibacillus contaminans]